jgi:hypothetical protein
MRPLLLCVFIAIFAISGGYAQGTYIPLNHDSYRILDRLEIKGGRLMNGFHTSNKPLDRAAVTSFVTELDTGDAGIGTRFTKVDEANLQWLYLDNSDWSGELGDVESKRKLFKVFYKHPAHFLSVDVPKFKFMVDPAIQFRMGMDTESDGLKFENTRGVELRGQVDDIFGFYAYITENQSKYPEYVRNYIEERKGIPDAGYHKTFKETGYDFFKARGYVTLSATKHVHFQFGYDKIFIGDGERSLFVSNFGNDYLFLKINTNVWKLNYQNVFAELIREYPRRADTLLGKKYMAMHHLSVNATRWLNIGIFESVVFSRPNTFEFQYLNPLIFYRSIEQALGSPDNAALGIDFKALIARHVAIYGQFLIDDLNFEEEFGNNDNKGFKKLTNSNKWWGTKLGAQLGVKYVDAFKVNNLDLQLEMNWVRPYTYTHRGLQTNWAHYNLPLAHPMGANLGEIITVIRYQPIHKLNITAKYFRTRYGVDNDTTNFGNNIFLPDTERERIYGNNLGQGINTKLNLFELLISYQPWHNIYLDFNYVFRNVKSEAAILDSRSHFWNVAARMNIPYKGNYF